MKWVETEQHAASLEVLNEPGLCPPDLFQQLVSFESVDMTSIPDELSQFDFLWSAGSFEHLGSPNRGIQFVEDSLRCLRPGGIAVHTTEFNVSNDTTVDFPELVLYSQSDIESLANRLSAQGHSVAPLDFDPGAGEADIFIDRPPYEFDIHLKLQWGDYVTTSIGLIITKATEPLKRKRKKKNKKKR